MGCYPLKELISRALGSCNGKKERVASNRKIYSPPSPVYTHRTAVVKSVNFSNSNPVYVIPPEPDPGKAIPNHFPEPAVPPPQPGPSSSERHQGSEPEPKPKSKSKSKGKKKARFASGPDLQDHTGPSPIQHELDPDYQYVTDPKYHRQVHHEQDQQYQGPVRREPGPAGRGPISYYAPSPLPRWESGQRRQEYFSGEYCYYPTPIREGIYTLATDPHRLTTIFSEENPNACSIS